MANTGHDANTMVLVLVVFVVVLVVVLVAGRGPPR